MKSRGFTLIELLVVISIIGLLSSVVLASLNSARAKAKDASAKAEAKSFQSQAALEYADNNNSYSTIWNSGMLTNTMYAQIISILDNTGNRGNFLAADSQSYLGAVQLKSGNFLCFDENKVEEIANFSFPAAGLSSYACP